MALAEDIKVYRMPEAVFTKISSLSILRTREILDFYFEPVMLEMTCIIILTVSD